MKLGYSLCECLLGAYVEPMRKSADLLEKSCQKAPLRLQRSGSASSARPVYSPFAPLLPSPKNLLKWRRDTDT